VDQPAARSCAAASPQVPHPRVQVTRAAATAPAAGGGTVMHVQTVVFDADQVPCRPDAIGEIYARLGWYRGTLERAGIAGVVEAAFADRPADLTDADAAHRHLLTARRTLRRTVRIHAHIADPLVRAIRPHSRLYGPRSCSCLRDAWEQFCDPLTQTIQALGRGCRWAVQEDTGVTYGDTHVYGLGGLVRTFDPPSRADTIPQHLTVTIPDDDHLQVTRRLRGATRTITWTRMTHAQATLAWRSHGLGNGPTLVAVPDDAARVAVDLAWAGEGLLDALADLTDRMGALTPEARLAAVELAHGWTGTLDELLHTASTVAA